MTHKTRKSSQLLELVLVLNRSLIYQKYLIARSDREESLSFILGHGFIFSSESSAGLILVCPSRSPSAETTRCSLHANSILFLAECRWAFFCPFSLASYFSLPDLPQLSTFQPRHAKELELIQTQMTQKPMLRAEVYARALRASQNRK
jgi:hypothetical protein